MRVGLLIYGLDRPFTGIGRYTLELTRALMSRQGDLELVLLVAGSLGPLSEAKGVHRASLPGCRLLPGLVTLGNVLIPLLARRLALDVVHDPTGVTPFLFGAGGAKTVVTVHDVFPWSYPGTSMPLETLIYRYWLPYLLRRQDAIITVSQASKADIVRFLRIPEGKVHVVYEGVSGAYRPALPSEIRAVRGRYGLPEGYILFVGSVERRKNLHGLLRAYARVRKAGERRPLVVVGGKRGDYPDLEATLRGLGLEGQVIFTGYLPEPDLSALYSGADLFVFPSLYEGFGLPVLEAMACGTPVVCSDVASLPEVAGDAALLVNPHDVDALAEAIRLALTDESLREELRRKGLERVKQFTWERTVREMTTIYREVPAS